MMDATGDPLLEKRGHLLCCGTNPGVGRMFRIAPALIVPGTQPGTYWGESDAGEPDPYSVGPGQHATEVEPSWGQWEDFGGCVPNGRIARWGDQRWMGNFHRRRQYLTHGLAA